ncbi:MAG: tetratricopeptide repeat protein [Bacteroidetes bacterium]|nr:MAG: tetratricopeptide repeat protein [Bacteroidota bacterium]
MPNAYFYLNNALRKLKRNQTDSALQDLARALDQHPAMAEAYLLRIHLWHNQKAYTQSLADCAKLLEIRPSSAEAHYWRGKNHYELNLIEEALADFTKAILLDARIADAFYMRGLVYEGRKAYREAIQDFSEVLELNANDKRAYHHRGLAYYELGEKQNAYLDWGKASELDYIKRKEGSFWTDDTTRLQRKQQTDKMIELARNQFKAEQYDEALLLLNKTIESEKLDSPAEAFYWRGRVYAKKKSYQDALKDLEETVRIEPDFAVAHFEIGVIASKVGEDERAMLAYSNAIEFDNKYTAAYYFRGKLRMKNELYDEALADFSQTLKLNPQYAPAHFERGALYYTLGNPKLACIEWLKAHKLGHPQAGDLYEKYKILA